MPRLPIRSTDSLPTGETTMTNEKAPRNMTGKGFLHKASGKVSAETFLAQHRNFLLTGELAALASPILKKMDDGGLLPSPALAEIRTAVMNHLLVKESTAGLASAEKAQASYADKPYLATIYDKDHNIIQVKNSKGETIDLQQSYALPQEAERWCDRRLEECAPDCRGEVVATHMNMMVSPISRVEALGRLLKQKGGSTGGKAPSGNLSWGSKVKQTKVTFSHG